MIGATNPEERLQDLVLAKIAENPQKRKIRTDAVYCVELLLTASPEYFRPDDPTRAGYWDEDNLNNGLKPTFNGYKKLTRIKLSAANYTSTKQPRTYTLI